VINLRLKVIFESESDISYIPLDYRPTLISMLKSALMNTPYYNELFRKKTIKPYTWSVYFGKEFKITNNSLQTSKNISFYFSTNDEQLIMVLFNGLLDLKKKSYKLSFPQVNFSIKTIIPFPPEMYNKSSIYFKTMSPVILTNPLVSKDEKNFYVTPQQEFTTFQYILNLQTRKKLELLGLENIYKDILFENINTKDTLIRHYGGFIKGFTGFFKITSSPQIITFLYETGMGVKTGSGFGYLDKVGEE